MVPVHMHLGVSLMLWKLRLIIAFARFSELMLKVIKIVFVISVLKLCFFICTEIIFFMCIASLAALTKQLNYTFRLEEIQKCYLLLLVASSSRRLASARWLLLCDIIALRELVVLSRIDEVLAVDITKLVIMSIDNDWARHETLESIIMALHNDLFNLAVARTVPTSLFAVW